MSIITFDIEADGLLRDATKVWCIALKIDEAPSELFVGDDAILKAHQLVEYIKMGHTLSGHNISGYDIPLLKKLYGIDVPLDKCIDTLLLSQMLEPEEFSHSLESWGEYLGDEKIKHEVWTEYSDEMGERCKKDCDITYMVYKNLINKPTRIPENALLTEMEFNRIMSIQEVNGWLFDKDAAGKLIVDLDKEIQSLSDDILSVAPKRLIPNKAVKSSHNKNGKDVNVNSRKWYNSLNNPCFDLFDLNGEYCTFEIEEMNLNSVKQVKEYLLTLGWRPTEFNYKKDGKRIVKDDNGKPIVTSPKLSNLDSLEDGIGSKISKRILYSHRRNQIRGWIERVRDDGRLEAGGQACACNTARVRHRNIVNVPKASDDIFLGKAMRSLFIADNDKVLVGADLDQLEARVAGHYTHRFDGGEYAELLLSGSIHEDTAKKLGITKPVAKQMNYALQYGAQVQKLASILGCSESRAGYIWNEWWNLRSSLQSLKEAVIASIESRGYDRRGQLNSNAYVKTIDGRPIFIRSWHSVLNALIQSTGSILFKEIVVHAMKEIRHTGVLIVGNFHDEVNFECREEDVDIVKRCLTSACEHVNIKYDLKVPLTMDVRVGSSWATIH